MEQEKGAGSGTPIPRKTTSNAKWYAIIAVLIVVIAGLGVAYAFKTTPAAKQQLLTVAAGVTVTGAPYSLVFTTNNSFSSVNVYWGDGTATMNYTYAGSNTVSLTHTYKSPGQYLIYYVATGGSGGTQTNSWDLYSVLVTAATIPPEVGASETTGTFALNTHYSGNESAGTGTNTFAPGTKISYDIGAGFTPQNASYAEYKQTVTQFNFTKNVGTTAMPYTFNATQGIYVRGAKTIYNGTMNAPAGLYTLEVTTYTAVINTTTGNIQNGTVAYNTQYLQTVAVFSNIGIYVPVPVTTASGTLTFYQLVAGGPKTFDGAIAYDTQSEEPLMNTNMYLMMYNGSSTSSMLPMLASAAPTYNTHWHNYTESYINQASQHISYAVNESPGTNYTFHIRSNATWQDGTPVTAWDVYYSIMRDLLFTYGSPLPPGWIIDQLYNYQNDYYNLTNNITVDNATNTVTFHFESGAQVSSFVEQVFTASGAFIMSAKWLESHGAGITFTPAGFAAYSAHAFVGKYFSYPTTHIFANGPYMLEYYVPGSELVLEANPNFVSPGPWYPAAKIQYIVIEWTAEVPLPYLALKSGAAQTGNIPTSDWNEATSMQKAGTVNLYNATGMSPFWWQFNAQINQSLLHASNAFPTANVPAAFFTNLNVRRAFAYAWNDTYYLDWQVGNSVFNTTFATSYAGMLPPPMLYGQTPAQLSAAGAVVPTYDLTMAKQYWTQFLNSPEAKAMGITSTGTYNGNKLLIPIALVAPDPVDTLAISTWAQNLSQVIFGTTSDSGQFPVWGMSFEQSIVSGTMGSNPMPITIDGWLPDYPYPTDFLLPMTIPSTYSYFLGASNWLVDTVNNPSNATSYNASEAQNFTLLNTYYNDSTSTIVPAVAEHYFHLINALFTNMTFDVYMLNQVSWEIWSTKIPANEITTYQQNVMNGQGGDFLYNYLTYT